MAFYELTPNQPQPKNIEDFNQTNVTGANMVVLAMEAGQILEQDDNDTLFKEIEALSNSEMHKAEDYMVVMEDDVDVVDGNRNNLFMLVHEEAGPAAKNVKKQADKTLKKQKEGKENMIPMKGKKKSGPKKKSKEQLAHSKALRKVRDQNVSVKSFLSLY